MWCIKLHCNFCKGGWGGGVQVLDVIHNKMITCFSFLCFFFSSFFYLSPTDPWRDDPEVSSSEEERRDHEVSDDGSEVIVRLGIFGCVEKQCRNRAIFLSSGYGSQYFFLPRFWLLF